MGEKIQFKVDTAELKKKINYVRNGLGSSRTDIPTMLMRFDVTGPDTAVIFTAENELFCRTRMKISRLKEDSSPKDGSFSLIGNKLEKLVSQSESEEVVFSAEQDNVQINSGFLNLNWELYDGSPLKNIMDGVVEHLKMEGTAVPLDALTEAIVCGRSCCTTDSVNPNFNHIELRNGSLLSSDGRKVMMYSHDGFVPNLTFKAPNTTLSALISAAKSVDAQAIQVMEGKSYYYLKAGVANEYTMGIRKVERSFPNLEELVKQSLVVDEDRNIGPTDEITMDKHVLNAMITGVMLGLPQNEVKIGIEVNGAGPDAYVEVSAYNSQGRKSYERASCTRKGEDRVSFPISCTHLQTTLGVFKGDSVVDLAILKDKNFMVVKDTTESRKVVTVIPFRTDTLVEEEKKAAAAAAEARKKEKEKTPEPAEEQVQDGAEAKLEEAVDLV